MQDPKKENASINPLAFAIEQLRSDPTLKRDDILKLAWKNLDENFELSFSAMSEALKALTPKQREEFEPRQGPVSGPDPLGEKSGPRRFEGSRFVS